MIVALIRESSQLRGEDQADSHFYRQLASTERLASSQAAYRQRLSAAEGWISSSKRQ